MTQAQKIKRLEVILAKVEILQNQVKATDRGFAERLGDAKSDLLRAYSELR